MESHINSFYDYVDNKCLPFGKAPYYCLNPAAVHYKQKVVESVKVTRCSGTKKPVGTFECSCGFIYSRRGPDKDVRDIYKIGRIKQFGHIWFEKLNQLLNIEKKSFYEASKTLNCDIQTVKKYASNDIDKKIETAELKGAKDKSTLTEKRDYWLKLQEQYPGYSKTQIREVSPATYTWLYRYDKDWLIKNSPGRIKSIPANNRVDWNKRDEDVLRKVKDAARELLDKDKPVRLNINQIGKKANKLSLLQKHLDKLPKTDKYLSTVLETIEEFQIRRVKWAVQKLINENEEVSEWRVKRLAGLKKEVNKKVVDEIRKHLFSF